MGDSARTKRREQLKRWAGSCTDKASAVPRRRWRGDAEDRAGEPEAELNDPPGEQSVSDEISPILKRRKSVRFDRAAEFLAACASGDTEEAQVMLKEAKDTKGKNGEDVAEIINCSNADGITALHQACIDGSMEIVTFLLENGANVNQVDSEGWTPLHVAASCGYSDIADFLLKQGASLSAVNCDGDVPLDIALDETTESLLQDYTLRQGVDLEAAKRLEEEHIMRDAQTWLTEGPPPDVRHSKTGATPLHVAAAKGYLEALKILCQCGLDVSAMDFDGWTPLHAAAHWGQGEACRVLAEQLCNMESRSNAGQTPFDVADESVEELLEELSQKQANWRNEQSILDRQNQQGPAAANAQNRRRRSSVCRMSSKDKMNVQDQSKERGISGDLELSEEKESSPESSTVSSPDTESVTTSTVSPADKTPEEKDEEEKEQDKANRTARVQPTPQTRDNTADSPNTPNADRRKFQAPVRDEESESQRKARSRLMRQSRRSTQGVTLTDLKEAEKTVAKAADLPHRNIQPVSPIVTITPAERDTDPVKQVESEGEKRLGVKERRRGRRERRSTGIVQPGGENDDEDAHLDDVNSFNTSNENQLGDLSADYRTLYFKILQENLALKDKLQEMELLLSQNKVELERLRQSQESGTDRPALLELERFEKLALQRKAVELEDELKVLGDLRADNQRLKDENAALIRVISKLSR
ncbi:protein phosphatase 1 regulatory subunit 12C-like [Seriola lalandi dorsalis]|uniref:Protein phosphatase 1 regulatory subunit n=1 Tax=Seriola lalandi dorsalis TaxID=1841481 RepID=A0A3B4WVC0_SERLL|nr:protein phosphatase 1 regulatory subunit 12C-like [Seriola lalandi dorsalis]XP_056227410.1 protein phosphatase 1 regulatory subunit 12C [Seriola aureovittata]